MKTIMPFPFDQLQQLSLAEVQLKKKILQIYQTAAGADALLSLIAQAIQEVVGNEVSIKLVSVESRAIDTALADIPEQCLVGVVRLDPLPQKAFFSFDHLLAQFLVANVLSGGQVPPTAATELKLKPLTVLQEAVVQYIVIDLIEKIAAKLGKKSFAVAFEDVLRETSKLKALYGPQDKLALLALKLSWFGHDFYIKFFLPISVADKSGRTRREDAFARQRLRELGSFRADVHLEIGSVSLHPRDIEQIDMGDIVFFDEMTAELAGGKLSGKARLTLATPHEDAGYVVALDTDNETIRAKVESVF